MSGIPVSRYPGVPADQAIGRRCSEVFHADICESVCAIRQTLETGREIIDQPAKILNQRGRSVPISISMAVRRTEDGNLLGAVETFRDLSTLEQLRKIVPEPDGFFPKPIDREALLAKVNEILN